MLTKVTPNCWIDLDAVRAICVFDDVVHVALNDGSDIELQPKNDGDADDLAATLVRKVNEGDEPAPSQRQALS